MAMATRSLLPSLGAPLLLLLLLPCQAALALHNVTVVEQERPVYPTSLDWDDRRGSFVLGSAASPHLFSVSDAGMLKSFLDIGVDLGQPDRGGRGLNLSVMDIKIDSGSGSSNNRILVVLHSFDASTDPYDALAAYDFSSEKRLFLARLTPAAAVPSDPRPMARRVCIDSLGNAYVTDSAHNLVWKVDLHGSPSVFSSSPLFLAQQHPRGETDDAALQGEDQSHSPDSSSPLPLSGLNGIAFASPGYLLLGQSNSGLLFKLSLHDSGAKVIECGQLFLGMDGIELRGDGTLVLVSSEKIWVLRSRDAWDTAQVVDTLLLDPSMHAIAVDVALREGNKPYILHSYVHALFAGNKALDEGAFFIQEVDFPSDREDPKWIALGIVILLIFIFAWKFQMDYFFKQYNKKRA